MVIKIHFSLQSIRWNRFCQRLQNSLSDINHFEFDFFFFFRMKTYNESNNKTCQKHKKFFFIQFLFNSVSFK